MTGYNLFQYCGNNPVNRVDPTGEAWWHWVLGAAVVVACAVAVVATAGGAAAAVAAVATVGSGFAATTTASTVAAAAFIGSATAYGMAVIGAASTSDSIEEFNEKGDWDVVLSSIGGAVFNGVLAYVGTRPQTPKTQSQSNISDGACFVAGTTILTATGNAAIETVEAGDFVWASNPETGEVALKQVVQTFVNETTELVHVTVDGEKIVCTNEQPFYSPIKGWIEACKLRSGDILVTVNGEYVVVEKVQHEILETPIKVYNFEVADFHTYYVGEYSVLVHNTCVNTPQSRGSTGRTEARNLTEQLAMEQVKSNPGAGTQLTNIIMNDTRWPASSGWVKMEQIIRTSYGKVNIHYVFNTVFKIYDDFKFKS